MLQDVTCDPLYIFNPHGFVADEHHANWLSLQNVFGKEVLSRVVSCEFHFKQSVQRHAAGLSQDDSGAEFICLADALLHAMSQSEFGVALSAISKFVLAHSQLKGWLDWWHARKTHVFRCFKPLDAPNSNLAEVGHAKIAAVGRPYMSLLEAAREDVAIALRQEAECKMFGSGLPTGGTGRTDAHRQHLHHKRLMQQAAAFGAEILGHHVDKYVASSGNHRPPSERRNKSGCGKKVLLQKKKKHSLLIARALSKTLTSRCNAAANNSEMPAQRFMLYSGTTIRR